MKFYAYYKKDNEKKPKELPTDGLAKIERLMSKDARELRLDDPNNDFSQIVDARNPQFDKTIDFNNTLGFDMSMIQRPEGLGLPEESKDWEIEGLNDNNEEVVQTMNELSNFLKDLRENENEAVLDLQPARVEDISRIGEKMALLDDQESSFDDEDSLLPVT